MADQGPPEPSGGSDGRPAREVDGVGPSHRWGLLLAVAGAVLVLDQLTKSWAVSALEGGRTIDLVWTLRLRLAFNRGASFSIGGEGGWGPIIAVAAVVVLALLLWQAGSMTRPLGTVALGLVLGGAVGNLVDRAVRGDEGFLHNPVVDFIDVQWWPVFNVADSAVVVGGIALLVVALLPDRS